MQEPSMLRLCLSQIVGEINHACFKDKKKIKNCLGGRWFLSERKASFHFINSKNISNILEYSVNKDLKISLRLFLTVLNDAE